MTAIMTSVERVQESLRAVDEWQATINAFVTVEGERALADARATDERRAAGRGLGAMDGIPIALKDMFDRPGQRCSFGSRFLQDPPSKPAAIVQSLQDAGAIILGTLNMAEFALGPTGHNSVFGHCRNPWNPQHITGGSSSGPAAVVAAGIVMGSIGSDSGGSIRIPAACCGIVGLKPTHGLVSVDGAMPLTPSLDCIGPFARNASDCETIFRLLAPQARGAAPRPRQLRVAFSTAAIANQTDPEIVAAIEGAVSELSRLGARITPARLPDIAVLHALAETVQQPEAAAVHRERLQHHRSLYTPHILRRVEAGLSVTAPDYIAALSQRSALQRAFVEHTLGDADAVIVPVLGFPVPRIDATDEAALGGAPEVVARMTRWTRWVSYLGVPALSLPCGFDRQGLPIGLQLVGRPFAEITLLQLASAFQEVTGWHSGTPSSPGDPNLAC